MSEVLRPRRTLATPGRGIARIIALAFTCAGAANAATVSVGPNERIRTIAEAAAAAKDGDVVEIAAGTYTGDVAVWLQRRLTIRGVGGRPVLAANGHVAEGKAIWVLRNGDFTVQNIAFQGARAVDRNGAGIRFERGRLRVVDCTFADNENGILTGNDAASELLVERSEFSHAPRDVGPLKHLIYVGRIGHFSLSGSRVHDGFEGHLVKSRARLSDIRYNLLFDGPGGRAAYELEFPNGGAAYVVGNVIGQSATTTNPVVVSYGAEGRAWPDNALFLSHNTLVSDYSRGAWFLRVWSANFTEGLKLKAVNNLTVGLGLFELAAPGDFQGNHSAFGSALSDPEILDFRLRMSDRWHFSVDKAEDVDGVALAPAAEFALPLGTRPLSSVVKWAPGAFQDAAAH